MSRKMKQQPRWQRDPEGMRARILAAARDEFATHGIAGARVDRIAETAGANKRMLYYHIGNKEDLYLAVLEAEYEHIRASERKLNLEALAPTEAIARLVEFTWQHYLDNPQFIALLNNENLHRARYLKQSKKVTQMHSPFVALIGDILRRGIESGDFRTGIDPVQLYISIASLSYFYQSNNATLSAIFGRDLLAEEARDTRLSHMKDLVLSAVCKPKTQRVDRLAAVS